mgnify:CR=1 FL=1
MKRGIILFLVVTLFGLSNMNCSGPETNAEEEVAKIPVEITKVTKGTVEKELTYTGDVKAEQEVKVFSKIPDRILGFEKDEGDYVEKGDVIARIEATKIKQAVVQAEAALASAKAQLANLKSEYQRAERLKKEDVMSEQQFETIKTQYEATQAAVEQSRAALIQAKSQLNDATITAPISGVIGVRNYEQGDMASGPLPLVTIVQMKRVKVEINAPEQDLGQLKEDLCANIKVTSYPDETFVGRINKIRPVLDPITRMGKIEILVDNEDRRLKPGMFAEVTICINTLQDVIVVPKHAVIENTALKRVDGQDVAITKTHIFVVENDTAFLREVDVSYSNGSVSVVSDGLNVSENIVVIGQQSLKDSSSVKIIESQN